MNPYLIAVIDIARTWWPSLLVLVPFIVSAIAKCSWSANQKGWFLVLLAALVGIVGALLNMGVPGPEALSAFVAAAIGGATVVYRVARSIEFTNAWLDKLLALGSDGDAS